MIYFCTYCDRRYAARMLALHASLVAQGEPFLLQVLCFDRETEEVVAGVAQPTLAAIPLSDLIEGDPGYADARSGRSEVEFYFTTTPVLIRHCLARTAEAQAMTYLDSDLYFFGPASGVWALQGDRSVGIVPHRFPPRLAERTRYGTYNVAWVSFRRDHPGLSCLEWWRARCLEWCHDYVEGEKFADQGYLNEFPRRSAAVCVLDHVGINAAPWNMDGVDVSSDGATVKVNGQRLYFFHFQGVREITSGWFEPGLRAYGTPNTGGLRELIYLPYLEELAAFQRRLRLNHGIATELGSRRLHAGDTARARWERAKARWVLPQLGRWRGQLLYAPEHAAPAIASASFRMLVVTPTLGSSPWLDETVASVSAQPFPCIHVLVAPAPAVAGLAARFPRAKVVAEPGGGMYAAINAGLESEADWDAFTYINDDDLLLPRFAAVVARARTTEPRVVYGGVRLINTKGKRIGAIPTSRFPSLNRALYAQRTEPVFQHGTVATRAVVRRLGGFDASFRFCGDSEFLARCCVAGIPFVCATKQVVGAFRLRAGQLTKNLPVMLEEHHRLYAKLKLPAEVITFRHRWARFVFRVVNLPVYAERIARHGFITFGEQLAKVE
ncbi:MAG: hypothetical protein JWM32_137 [Verrucomicrobia bacterium]|nr:hypothetical protein [Verrucomicrobiota bacterium]